MERIPKGARMKTLNEVIKAFEYTYENDPIAWSYGVDALNYLKELQELNEKSQNTFVIHGE